MLNTRHAAKRQHKNRRTAAATATAAPPASESALTLGSIRAWLEELLEMTDSGIPWPPSALRAVYGTPPGGCRHYQLRDFVFYAPDDPVIDIHVDSLNRKSGYNDPAMRKALVMAVYAAVESDILGPDPRIAAEAYRELRKLRTWAATGIVPSRRPQFRE